MHATHHDGKTIPVVKEDDVHQLTQELAAENPYQEDQPEFKGWEDCVESLLKKVQELVGF